MWESRSSRPMQNWAAPTTVVMTARAVPSAMRCSASSRRCSHWWLSAAAAPTCQSRWGSTTASQPVRAVRSAPSRVHSFSSAQMASSGRPPSRARAALHSALCTGERPVRDRGDSPRPSRAAASCISTMADSARSSASMSPLLSL